MTDDRLKALLALSDVELARPLWEWPPAQRRDVIRARDRRFRRYGDDTHERVTEFAETE